MFHCLSLGKNSIFFSTAGEVVTILGKNINKAEYFPMVIRRGSVLEHSLNQLEKKLFNPAKKLFNPAKKLKVAKRYCIFMFVYSLLVVLNCYVSFGVNVMSSIFFSLATVALSVFQLGYLN